MKQENLTPEAVRNYIIQGIDEAIEKKYIQVYFQPVIRTLTGEVCGMEALARWEDPNYGLLSPDFFISTLEEASLIHKLDICIIRQICEIYAGLMERGEDYCSVSFNLSRLDFQLCDIHSIIDEAIGSAHLPKDLFRVEITESMMEKNEERMQDAINRFWDRGLRVWMDDFGSGYSSLNVLKDYHFDTLKIDMLFLRDFDPKAREIIRSIVDMSKRIGVHTLAEGVETEEQLLFLRNMGCEKAQGFYIGRPEPYEQCVSHLREKGYRFERPELRHYYHEIGKVNILSASPMAESNNKNWKPGTNDAQVPLSFVELSGGKIRYLFANEAYLNTLKSLNIASTDTVEKMFEGGTGRFGASFLSAMKKARMTKLPANINFMWGKNHCFAQVKCVADHAGGEAFLCILNNYSMNEQAVNDLQMTSYVSSMFGMYDHIELVDLTTGYSTNFYLSMQTKNTYNLRPAAEELKLYAKTEIHPEDSQRFIEFTDPTTAERQLQTEPYLTAPFRVLMPDGSYAWKLQVILHAGDRVERKLFYCMRMIQTEALKRVAKSFLKELGA